MSKSLNKPRPSKKKLAQLCQVLSILEAYGPDPKTELYFNSPFQLLLAVALSAQTTDKAVNRCLRPLFDANLDPEGLLEMGYEAFLEQIKTIGLAPTKAKNALKMASDIMLRFGGQVPRAEADLLSLPGVGIKTAAVVRAELYGEPTLAVDTHVYRVSSRLGWQQEKTPAAAQRVLEGLIPLRFLPSAHHHLILHGRYTCKAQKPLCNECLIKKECPTGSGKR